MLVFRNYITKEIITLICVFSHESSCDHKKLCTVTIFQVYYNTASLYNIYGLVKKNDETP